MPVYISLVSFPALGQRRGKFVPVFYRKRNALCDSCFDRKFCRIALTFGAIQAVNILADGIVGRHEATFTYHPLVFAVTILASFLTVLISAWLSARKLSKMTPLEAIKNMGELQLKRRKKSRILALLFGTEGELAGNALKAQKKSLRTATLSLTLSSWLCSHAEFFYSLWNQYKPYLF